MPTDLRRELTGKHAVVTGSSSGIGRAIAIELAAAGANVLVHAGANREAAEQTADSIRRLGVQAAVALADFAEPSTHEPFVESAWSWQGAVDIWINNAGADVLTGPAAAWSFDEKLDRLWQVNARSTICLSRLVGGRMKPAAASDGSATRPASATFLPTIINLGWDQADHGMAGDAGEMFAAIKAAVAAFTRSLARSLAPQVRVNAIAPGWIQTAWSKQTSEYWQQRARSESLLDRWGTPEDVARLARFLASPAAEFINGQVIPVNGGFRHRA